jgi:mono/diheme cytochrome c family protein
LALALVFALGACGDSADDQAAMQAEQEAVEARAQEEAMAEAQLAFDPAAFDTISWENRQAAMERGATVFRFSCQKCHGVNGAGDGGFVQAGDTLRPPSFRVEDWRFAEDMDGLREMIFVGATEGMPHWGLEGLKYRDVDAVAQYIQGDLRN